MAKSNPSGMKVSAVMAVFGYMNLMAGLLLYEYGGWQVEPSIALFMIGSVTFAMSPLPYMASSGML